MRQFPLEFLQRRAGGNRIVPGGSDSHPFRFFYTRQMLDIFLYLPTTAIVCSVIRVRLRL